MQKLLQKLFMTITIILCCCTAKAQGTEVSNDLKEVYKSGEALFYRFNYPSKSATGEDVVLSSLLIAWMPSKPAATDSIESLHIYSHYTITADQECPSSDSNSTDRMLFGMLAKSHHALGLNPAYDFVSRCVVIAPDYEGFGASRNLSHPYLSQELTAQQVMDGVKYGMTLYQKLVEDNRALAFKSDWRTFSYGFSQGGAVALAVHRHIEQNGLSDELHFRGSICGDGPYDLIATLRYYLQDNGTSYGTKTEHRQGMSTMPMVLPMIIKGMLDTHPDMKAHRLEDYLSKQFLDTGIMDWLASKQYSTGDISRLWYDQLQKGLDAQGRHYSPEQMAELFYSPKKNTVWAKLDRLFTPDFYAYITDADKFGTLPTEKGNVWQDIHRAMLDNSVCEGWEPQHRIQFVHSKGDMVVPYGNYLSFRDAHPDGEGELYRIDSSISSSDHSTVGTQFFLYLTTTGSYGAYFKWLDESPATGIQPIHDLVIDAFPFDDAWYDLHGRRLSGEPSTKGIYIHKGRKMIR